MRSDYSDTLRSFDALFKSGSVRDEILLQTCKLLKDKIQHYDWVGFYLLDRSNGQLILGPFVGKPTEHTIIPIGRGVCGQVAETKMIKIVQDIKEEENYLSCSLDVKSEIVVPVLKNGEFVAEIDIDSHSPSPFKKDDEELLTKICEKISLLF